MKIKILKNNVLHKSPITNFTLMKHHINHRRLHKESKGVKCFS